MVNDDNDEWVSSTPGWPNRAPQTWQEAKQEMA
jgi:hypothetical protein